MRRLLTILFLSSCLSTVSNLAYAQCDDSDVDGDGQSCVAGDCDDTNPLIYLGAPEICDGEDNDCDLIADNPPDGDGDGENICNGDCDDNDPNRFSANPEVCDGVDNDCNPATLDSSFTRACYNGPMGTQGVGLCQAGTETCDGPTGWSGTCDGEVTPEPTEQCDNDDHDCDGDPFNGLPDNDNDGSPNCLDCAPNNPNRFPGNPEVCDGVDNDCNNGTLDSSFTRACYTGPISTQNVGLCSDGTETCDGPMGWSGTCAGETVPQPEQCDTQDHDCDGNNLNGIVDVDGDGSPFCLDCDDNDPNNYPGNNEVCDGQDNDCDALTDERNNGTPIRRSCYTGPGGTQGVGICQAGIELCDAPGGWSGVCGGQVLPDPAELCDTTDHDCDGDAYNGFANADGDPVPLCEGDCDDNNPARYPGNTEICDGIDNDCNMLVDENFDNDGDSYTTCGMPPDCNDNDPGVYPGAPEDCNGIDDDCDGQIDEDFTDADMDGFVFCGPNADCDDNNPVVFPGNPEQCDGFDNDCDTLVDERNNNGDPLRRRCYSGPAGTSGVGTCRRGWESCTTGMWPGTCPGEIVPVANEVCDNADDDCDGQTDEDFDTDMDGFTTCSNPVDCDDTNPAMFPGNPEDCDGLDNDCDTGVDEDVNGDPLTQACYTGPGGTEGVGLCAGGTNSCNGAQGYDTTVCNNEVLPAPDLCDGDDNNCDGTVDEGFDADMDGFTSCNGDCNDADPMVNPDALELCNNIDDNCDMIIDGTNTQCYSGPVGTATVGLCQPGTATCMNGVPTGACNGEILPQPEICDFEDNDCDGLIDEDFDLDGDGVASCAGDCDDTNPFVSPNIPERCDCADNNCDGTVDEDGFGGSVCDFGACHDFDRDGFTNCEGDCNDRDTSAFPGAPEICGDGIDNNCNGLADEDVDEDNDGFTTCGGDCDDRFAEISPAAAEVCDAFDNNCDGTVDEGFDQDGDFATVCAGDCDDNDRNKNPFRREICGDGIDNDCDGEIDNDEDLDGDGMTTCEGDCNDYNVAVYAGAPEVCDGHDNDCNAQVDEGFDVDGDTFATCFGDCDDSDPAINPFAPERVDNVDNNCDGQIDEGQNDDDGDGFSYLCGDCNDGDPDISPQTVEICDGRDNDCDGIIDRDPSGNVVCSQCNDVDNDGVTDCDGDCEDSDPTVRPGAEEVCDGKDNTCDGRIDFDIVTQTNVCIEPGDGGVTDSSTSAIDGGVSGTDSGTPDGGVTTPVNPFDTPLDVGCGCNVAATSAAPHSDSTPWLAVLLIGALGLRRRRRVTQAMLIGLLALAFASGCTNIEVGTDPTDGGVSEDVADAGEGDADTRDIPKFDVSGDSGVDSGVDTGPLTSGACRLQNPDSVRVEFLPETGSFVLAVHEGTVSTPLTGVNALSLDDESRALRAFALETDVPVGIDPNDLFAATKIIDEVVDPLFYNGIPGVTGAASRVDETLKQSFFHEGLSAARTLRRITMSNVVIPGAVRNGLLASMSGAALSSIGDLPALETSEATTELLLAAYTEVEPGPPAKASVIVALGGLSATSSISTRLADLTNATHIAPAGSILEVRCDTSTATALQVDFMWVVDNSASMQEEQQALAETADSFFQALQTSQINFRLGVVTTDGETLRGGGFTTDLQEFKDNVRVGINGNGREQGLEFALRAVNRARNATIEDQALRSTAVPVLVFFSDEDSTMLQELDTYVDELSREEVLAFAIVGPRPRGCSAIGRGAARVGENYIRVAEELGGTSASICSEDFTEPIRELLIAAAGRASETRLSNLPISGTIEVAYPQQIVPRNRDDGFDYESGGNAILFFGPAAPDVGTEFRATYRTFEPFIP